MPAVLTTGSSGCHKPFFQLEIVCCCRNGTSEHTGPYFELIMGQPILAVVVFGLAMLHGWLWSVDERRKAVQSAYDEILEEVRRERRGV